MNRPSVDAEMLRGPVDRAGDFAVLTKLLRVAMLLPVVAAIALAVRSRVCKAAEGEREPLLPLFLLAFVALVVAGSLGLIPRPVGAALNETARACLAVAIVAVGLKISPSEMKKVGRRPLRSWPARPSSSRRWCWRAGRSRAEARGIEQVALDQRKMRAVMPD